MKNSSSPLCVFAEQKLDTRRKNAQKVVVAMSGGVDSSVAAALLKRAGFNVVGVFMKFWAPPGKDGLIGFSNQCCSPDAEIRARRVAKILKIPFYVFNFEKEFKKRIVDYFLNGYKKGITPNPCVVCNKEIKFGLFLEKALAFDADYVATGHYARLKDCYIRKKFVFRSLLKAKDKEKDQSYFLWTLNQKQLKKILFPIGDYTRAEVEKMAQKFKLPVLKARKSVEICFIQTTIEDFLSRYFKPKAGQIANRKGEVLGEHQGLWYYTIGQRRGIKLPGGPYYVLDKDLKKNTLIVTKNEKDLPPDQKFGSGGLYKKELRAKNINWISGKIPKLPIIVKAKIRYRHKAATAVITKTSRSKVYSLKFKVSQRAITPGQSVVFYKGQELLGGGIINK